MNIDERLDHYIARCEALDADGIGALLKEIKKERRHPVFDEVATRIRNTLLADGRNEQVALFDHLLIERQRAPAQGGVTEAIVERVARHLDKSMSAAGPGKADDMDWDEFVSAVRAALEDALSAQQQEGEIAVTKDAAGNIVAVTRQDSEGRILSTIAMSAQQQETPCSLDEALAVIEAWADHGNTLTGDDMPRFRALADRIAPQQQGQGEAGSAHKSECPVKMARVICEAIVRHQFQDEHRHGRLTLDVETFLREFNSARDAGLTAALAKFTQKRSDG